MSEFPFLSAAALETQGYTLGRLGANSQRQGAKEKERTCPCTASNGCLGYILGMLSQIENWQSGIGTTIWSLCHSKGLSVASPLTQQLAGVGTQTIRTSCNTRSAGELLALDALFQHLSALSKSWCPLPGCSCSCIFAHSAWGPMLQDLQEAWPSGGSLIALQKLDQQG